MSTVQTVQTIASSASLAISHESNAISHEITTSQAIPYEITSASTHDITTSRDFSLKNKSALFEPITPTAIYFPIERIDVSCNKDTGELKKDVVFCKKWKTLDTSDPHHPLVAIKTGHQSDITVVDFDLVSSYEKVLKAIPELAAVRTVKTRQGFHLYFTFEPQLKTIEDCFTVKKVDIRSEGGCILAPPTFYSYKDQVFRYEDLGGVVGPIPEALFAFMKPSAFKEAEVKAAEAASYQQAVITEESPGATVDQVRHLVSLLSPQRAVSYTTWSEVGFAIHHVLHEEGLPIFIEFSKTGGQAYHETGCIQFYRKLRHRYGSSLRMGSLCYWAGQDNAAGYKAYKAAYPYIAPSLAEAVECSLPTEAGAGSAISLGEGYGDRMSPPRTVANDWEAGLLIYGELSKVLMYSSGSLYFKRDHLWIQNEAEIRSAIRLYTMKAGLYKMNSKKERAEYSQQYKNACCIVQCVVDQAIAHQDNGWAQALYSSSYGYVLFTNGYWDFKGCRFVAMDSPEFDDSICFLEQIPFDYKAELGAQHAARVHHTLFLEPFGPRVADYVTRQLARGLAGDSIKRFLVGIGPSNTGKSILTGALRSACGSYFGDWTAANLADRHTSQDGGQQMRWLLLLRTKRIVVSNELKTRQSLDSNIMKLMSNGGDDGIVGREHGGNEQQGVTMRLLPILLAQDLPKILPIDDALSNRLRAIPYSKVYVDEPSNALELKKDPGLVSDIKTEAFRMGLLQVLFDAYTRFHQGGQIDEDIDEIREAVTDVIGTELNIIDSFKLHFEITNDPEDFVLSSVMKSWLIDGKYGVTDTKLGMELKRYVQIQGLTNVFNKNKKINRKTIMVWHGIREFPEEE